MRLILIYQPSEGGRLILYRSTICVVVCCFCVEEPVILCSGIETGFLSIHFSVGD